MAELDFTKLVRNAALGLLVFLFLTSCQASQTMTASPTLPLATAAESMSTSYPAPASGLATISPATAYPVPESSNQAIPVGEDQGVYPAPYSQPIPIEEDQGAYPAPYPGDITPSFQSQSPVSTTQPLNSTGTSTTISTPPAPPPTNTSIGEYPLPEGSTPSNGSQSFGPYPGPDSQDLSVTPTPGGTSGTESPGVGSGENGGTQLTATPTPLPGLVRTQLEASDPKDFNLVAGEIQLVEFFAFWSPISKSMAPVMYVLEDRYQNRIHFTYLDIDDPANNLYKKLLDNRLPPVFFLLDGVGNVIQEWQGYVKAEDFEAIFAKMTSP